jgi:hypothetical protein
LKTSVKSKVKQSIKNLFYRKNRYVFRTTDENSLNEFFMKVRPVTTNHKLIRIGGDSDGGYLLPDDLNGIKACFSPGVADTASFESSLISRGIKCYLADYSVEGSPIKNELVEFEKKYLGPIEDEIYMTLEDWVNRKCPNDNDLLLQMDIEGAEYGVVFDTSGETLKKFRIIVIEFHKLDSLIQKSGFELIDLTFSKLLKYFDIVHIHPNNVHETRVYKGYEIPPIIEVTFLRKDRISSKEYTGTFPHQLDVRNNLSKEDITLPACWYK